MDNRTLAEMELRIEDATPGPWVVNPEVTDPQELQINAPSGDARLGYGAWQGLVTVYGSEDEPYTGEWVAKRNATFICHARSDMRVLVNEVRRLQREIEAMSREEDARLRIARRAGAEAMRYAAVQALSSLWDRGARNIVGTMKPPFSY